MAPTQRTDASACRARRSEPPCRGQQKKAPAFRPAPALSLGQLDAGTDARQDAVDLTAEERDRRDRQDGDQGQDQRVLSKTLTTLVAVNQADQVLEHLRNPPLETSPSENEDARNVDRAQPRKNGTRVPVRRTGVLPGFVAAKRAAQRPAISSSCQRSSVTLTMMPS